MGIVMEYQKISEEVFLFNDWNSMLRLINVVVDRNDQMFDAIATKEYILNFETRKI